MRVDELPWLISALTFQKVLKSIMEVHGFTFTQWAVTYWVQTTTKPGCGSVGRVSRNGVKVTANGHKLAFWGDGNVLNSGNEGSPTALNILTDNWTLRMSKFYGI